MKHFLFTTILTLFSSNVLSAEPLVTIDQKWDDKARAEYWYTPQGSYIIPYNWFLKLKDESGRPLTATLGELGFINGQYEGPLNPNGLPIGLTIESEPQANFPVLKGNGPWLGITCAACHTGSIVHGGKEIVIDGAPGKIDFEKFSLSIEKALRRQNPGELGVSQATLDSILTRFANRNTRSFFGHDRSGPSANAGPGRTDAFGVILNEVVSEALNVPSNASIASAPVSYPPVWDAPYLQWIQYNGLSNNAFTRNVGEVLGVFGMINLNPNTPDFLTNTVRFDNLRKIESRLRSLQAPAWNQIFTMSPEEQASAARGEQLFTENCARCHNNSTTPNVVSKFGGKFRSVAMIPATQFASDNTANKQYIGTDPWYFGKLQSSWSAVDTGLFQGSSILQKMVQLDPSIVSKLKFYGDTASSRGSLGQSVLAKLTQNPTTFGAKENGVVFLAQTTLALGIKYVTTNHIEVGPNAAYMELTGGADMERQERLGAYKARSLHGVWSTGPYLHNGSVRTLRDLLRPAYKREIRFRVGSAEFDEKDVGFVNKGAYEFVGNKMGNLAIGHEFGTSLAKTEKDALLAYLKTLK